jgi:2-C-methyl-D-erythritol 4-phosphate cytidylyltransferase
VETVTGGAERCHSVLNGLEQLAGTAGVDDWVLVHDAARPCVRRQDIEMLMSRFEDHAVGGLLGLPVADTMKQVDSDSMILKTVERDGLWRALTPQMFRLGPLRDALQQAIASGVMVTDDAAAMEMAGYRARMVEGQADNIKITRPADLQLAEFYLQSGKT